MWNCCLITIIGYSLVQFWFYEIVIRCHVQFFFLSYTHISEAYHAQTKLSQSFLPTILPPNNESDNREILKKPSQFPAAWKIRENSRLQPGPWAWWTRSSLATASEQSGHWLNLDLFSHSPSRCSVRLAISTTCEHNAKLYSINLVMQNRYFQQLDLTLWLQLYNRSENLVRKINKKISSLPVDIRRSAATSDSVSSSEGPIRLLWKTRLFYRRIYTSYNRV